MAELALERYFDEYIANNVDQQQTSTSGLVSVQDPEGLVLYPPEAEDTGCDIFSLPDELLTLGRAADKESSTSLDHNAQNPENPEEPENPENPEEPEEPEIQHPHILPRIKNVVSRADLGCLLDLKAIAHRAWNVHYHPEVFKALVMKLRYPPTTAMFYRTGKMLCLGAKSTQDSYLATRRFGRIVQRLGFPVRFLDFKVVNIVAKGWVPPMRLEPLARHHLCSYEPELFPGLFLKRFHGASFTIFPTGNIVMMGANSEEQVQQAFCSLVPFLSSFRKP
ncbi:uncharacterized protein [Clinocottus analis]|uniref:uncharacterized protein isoform X2 n=1 Tax=Clinocottus analis TaxID=304258 RepID=UPI0035C1A79A